MAKLLTFALAAILPLAVSAQQTITLNDGTRFQGRLVGAENRTVTFEDNNGDRHSFNFGEVQSINFNGNTAYNNNHQENRAYESGNRSRNGRDRGAVYATIPSGSELVVRTNERIESSSATEGRAYSAQVDRDVLDSAGNVIIPRGSGAQLVIRDVSRGGTVSGPQMALDLQSLTVNGQSYYVSTQDVQRGDQGVGANRRTGEYVGGGAVLGTLLGAIAGGGKGALIGAIAGAAAGGGVQVLTRGKEIRVPAETVLTFRLDQPLSLNPM